MTPRAVQPPPPEDSELGAAAMMPLLGYDSAVAQLAAIGMQPPPGLPLPPGLQVCQSEPSQIAASPALEGRLSMGSLGHPHCCAPACRFVKRKGGCKDGASCPNCHLCFWRRSHDRDRSSLPSGLQAAS